LYNPQYKTFFKYIVGCTNRNTIFFLNTLRVVQTAIQFFFKYIAGCTTRNTIFFQKNFVLPIMYLKKILYCGLYNPQCI